MGFRKDIKTASIEINKIHKILCHCGESQLKLIARTYNINVFGKLEACEACVISKAKQKRTNRVWTRSSNVPGEQLYVDIRTIKGERFGGTKLGLLL